jgi:UrcA family protein
MRQFLMIASAALVLASATSAVAAGHTWRIDADAFNVHLSDLDLHLPAGRAQALVRIEAVAVKLCRKAGTYAARKDCREQVVGQVAQLPGSAFVGIALAERQQANVRLAQSK